MPSKKWTFRSNGKRNKRNKKKGGAMRKEIAVVLTIIICLTAGAALAQSRQDQLRADIQKIDASISELTQLKWEIVGRLREIAYNKSLEEEEKKKALEEIADYDESIK